ncbi:hypothetical protein HK405_006416 [Cladochytrium tenue]|nr:hypothetical protein HK405_006416 [Cladochytrium tenue]
MAPTQIDRTIVLITGANSGVGFATAELLAANPNYHVVLAVRSLDKGRAAIADIRARAESSVPPSLSLVQLDVVDPASISAAAAALADDLPRIDVVINNAGIVKNPAEAFPGASSDTVTSRTLDDLSAEIFDTFATNSVGPALVTAALLPLLKRSASPRLIYISSGFGSIGRLTDPGQIRSNPTALAYRMSKAALNMLTVYHHREFSPWGCRVWAICPGFVTTNLTAEKFDTETLIRMGARGPETSAMTIADVIDGKRDEDVGKFIHKDGVYPW